MSSKLKWYIKPSTQLLVPSLNDNVTTSWNQFLTRMRYIPYSLSTTHINLGFQNIHPLPLGPSPTPLPPYKDNDVVDKILDSTISPFDLGLTLADIDNELDAVIRPLHRAVGYTQWLAY